MQFEPFASPATTRALYRTNSPKKAALLFADTVRQLFRSMKSTGADVIYVLREASLIGPAWYERIAAARAPIVFDFDDAIWLPQEGSANPRWQFLRNPGKTETLCRLASTVLAGNEYLANYARRYSTSVSIVPSTVDLDVYGAPRIHVSESKLTVGWIGSHSTVRYLSEILPELIQAAKVRSFKLLVVGATLQAPPGLDIECRTFDPAREAADLKEMDVGLMPLPDSEWTRGKCAMKAIQYLAVGVPVIASDVGMVRDVVLDGVTGVLARTGGWPKAVAWLLSDAKTRAFLGANGRELVAERYSAAVCARRVAELLKQASDTAPS